MFSPQKRGRIPELDGLRGLAIFLVVIFHYVTNEGPAAAGSLAAAVQRTVQMWGTGVDLFFVLSGFLIGGILMDTRESTSYFSTFYIRRFFRIIPIYYLWITLYIVLVAGAGPFLKAHAHSGLTPQLGWPIYIHYLFLQNFGLFSLAGLAGAWFGPTWSLAIEEQFYLLAPAVMRIVSPRRISALLLSIIVGIPILRIVFLQLGHPSTATIAVSVLCRADTLAMGILAAYLWRRPAFHLWAAANLKFLYVLWLIFLAGFAALWKWAPEAQAYGMETIGFSCIGLAYVTTLLLALLHSNGPIAVLMRMRWLRELGRISYCVYIIHVAVNVICQALILRQTPHFSTPRGLAVSIFAALLTCAIAELSWRLFEHPLLQLGHKFKYSPQPMPAPDAGGMLAAD